MRRTATSGGEACVDEARDVEWLHDYTVSEHRGGLVEERAYYISGLEVAWKRRCFEMVMARKDLNSVDGCSS
jgi:hypothetical protein